MPTQNAIRIMSTYPMWTVQFGNRRGSRCVTEIALKSLRYRNRPEIPVLRDRSFITFPGGGGGGGYFENAQNVRGVGILRHRAGLLFKSCQTVLALLK